MKRGPETDLQRMQEEVRRFCEERQWDRFHSAKDLAIGIAVEAAELLELFRFLSPDEVEEMMRRKADRRRVADEMADILAFLLRLAQRYRIDLEKAFADKMDDNRRKYPVERARGTNRKHTHL